MKKQTANKRENHYFANSNYRIIAENHGNITGFDIWLDLSGRRHYLMYHRHNAALYILLKDGISLGDLARWKPENASIVKRYFGGLSKRHIDRMTHAVEHVLKTAEAYLAEMQETDITEQETAVTDRGLAA